LRRDATLRSLAAPGLVVLAPVALGNLLVMGTVLFRTGLGAYGGGFAVIPSLHTDIHAHGWVSEQQFADAVAVGKLTPGPVLLMATFIGYLSQGLAGALVATIAIMSGPFLLVMLFGTTLERLRGNAWVQAGLSGLSATVVGMMAAAALTLGTGFHSVVGAAIATAVTLTLVRFEVNPVAMLAVGGLLRLGLSFAGV
jgi:chromate transporter